MKRIYLLSLIMCTLLFCVCSDDKITEPEEEVIEYTFDNFVNFDNIGYVLLKANQVGLVNYPEFYLWWEKNMGEPFTDVNGNGIYDAGVDGFIISSGSDNQDVNFNGEYDGPDVPWELGFSYDDINGDGVRVVNRNWGTNITKTSQTPYADFNQNGQWDEVTDYNTNMAKCSTEVISENAFYHGFVQVDSLYYFLSDSGFHYYLTGQNRLQNSIYSFNFMELIDSGLVFSNGQWKYKLLDTGLIISDSVYVIDTAIDLFVAQFEIGRRTLTGESLTIDGKLYNDLVRITVSYLNGRGSDDDVWDFYFDHDLGLIAMHIFEDFFHNYVWIYFDARIDTIPLPMIR